MREDQTDLLIGIAAGALAALVGGMWGAIAAIVIAVILIISKER